MYISDINDRCRAGRVSFSYLLAAVFCALFGAVYERFSHEVYSSYMLYAFAFPLVGGALPFGLLANWGRPMMPSDPDKRGSYTRAARPRPRMPGPCALGLYGAGIATLTVGSIFRGVLDIYGTSNSLVRVYWTAGIVLIALGLVVYLADCLGRGRAKVYTTEE